jgi:hypothetical protein
MSYERKFEKVEPSQPNVAPTWSHPILHIPIAPNKLTGSFLVHSFRRGSMSP